MSVHLNGDEAMCFGSAFIAANSSSSMKVKQVFLTAHPPFDVTLKISPLDPSDAISEEDQKAEGVEEDDIIKYNQEIKLFNSTDYLGKSKGLSMHYNKNMKLELFKMDTDGTEVELLETFTLDDVKEQYDESLNLYAKDLEREKKKKEAKNANKTEEEKAQEDKKEEEEAEAPPANPKVKLSIEFSRSGYLQLTKATVGIKDRTLFLHSKQARREAQLDDESMRTAKSRLKWYTKRDENKIKTDEAKNNFESMIYTMRDWLRDDENAAYVEEAASAAYIEQLTEWEDWLYDEGSNLMYNVYEDMYKNMTKDLDAYKSRKSQAETRPEFIERTNQALDKMKEAMEEDFESAATQEEKTDVIDKISEVKTWFNDLAE